MSFSGLNGLRLLALCGGVALFAVNANAINTLLPSIVADLGGLGVYSWATGLFLCAALFSVALVASCVAALGLRASFLLAILVFILGSMSIAFSPTMYWLIVARVVQGLGSGLLLGLSYTAIRLVFARPLWLRATAIISSMWGVSALAGPAVGGFFAEYSQWRMAFIAVIPMAVLQAFLVQASLKTNEDSDKQPLPKIPIFKASFLAWSVVVILFGSLSASYLLITLAFVIAFTILHIVIQDDHNYPQSALFPLNSFAVTKPLGSLFVGMGLMSMVSSITVYVPYFLQVLHGMSPWVASYITALLMVGWAVGALLAIRFSPAVAQAFFIIGPLCSALALISLGVLMPWSELTQSQNAYVLLGVPLFVVGLGLGLVWPHLITRAFKQAPEGQENITSAALITLQLYTVAVGIAVAGVITTEVGLDVNLAYTQLSARWLFMVFAVLPLLFLVISKPARMALKAP